MLLLLCRGSQLRSVRYRRQLTKGGPYSLRPSAAIQVCCVCVYLSCTYEAADASSLGVEGTCMGGLIGVRVQSE